MAIPDTISALLVPFIGALVDKFGQRTKCLMVAGVIMVSVHSYFSIATASSPKPFIFLCFLGLSYALLTTGWSCIPLVVSSTYLATAFGIATAAMNTSLVLFPIIVAYLQSQDPSFFKVEVFFVFLSLMGILCAVFLYFIDRVKRLGLESGVSKLEMHPMDSYFPVDQEIVRDQD